MGAVCALESSMKATRPLSLVHYGIAILCVAVAMLARWLLAQAFGDRFFFITFYPAVMIAAYFGGLRPGLLATALSTLLVGYFWLPSVGSLGLSRRTDWVAILFFVFNGIIISAFSEALHATRRKVAAHANRAFELSYMLDATL